MSEDKTTETKPDFRAKLLEVAEQLTGSMGGGGLGELMQTAQQFELDVRLALRAIYAKLNAIENEIVAIKNAVQK